MSPNEAAKSTGMADFSDADAKRSIWRALRLIGVVVLVAAPLIWWRAGWQSALLLVVGAAISGSGLFGWLRLMMAILARMEATTPPSGEPGLETGQATHSATKKPRPMARILLGFAVRMAVALGSLYVSLRFLDGSAYALLAGLAMGAFALLVESLRLMRSWAA